MSDRRDKRILLFGGTGAIGKYLVPELLRLGYTVYVTSRRARVSTDPNLHFLQGNPKRELFFNALMEAHFDAIVDFMIYQTEEFGQRVEPLLAGTDQYIFLSSYRVYANSGKTPLTEQSPRLLETETDPEYLISEEYALVKARQENYLRSASRTNYTIVRPSITYSGDRFQLGTMEIGDFIGNALSGKDVLLAEEMCRRQATMTWAGDVAKMIARLVLNEKAYGETYTASTAEHHTWGEIAKIYRDILGMQFREVDEKTYVNTIGRRWQLKYDRLYDRIVDNSKILEATGLKQTDLMPLYDGLRIEL
jgi:nucleoside-diphosphate-sugar epimerase